MQIIAHRGMPLQHPENTTESFLAAIDNGATAIEFDVRSCASGEPVVLHDSHIDRTSNGRGFVSRLTLVQLKKLSFGNDQHILTLSEAIECIVSHRPGIRIFIELKDPATTAVSHEIRQLLQRHVLTPTNICVASFYPNRLVRVKQDVEGISTYLFLPPAMPAKVCLRIAVRYQLRGVITRASFRTKSQVDMAHAQGIEVISWATDQPATVYAAQRLGVDGVFTNFTDKVSAAAGTH